MPDLRTKEAAALMEDFAQRTGLTSEHPPRRYLWTDAFAVCNLLGLARVTDKKRYKELALNLADQVHHTLGRHRSDDPRSGWISGLDEHEGEAHPTRGGLRIGKPLPERRPNDPFDEQLEWERDGQYFHYLTKWMHALDQLSRATGQPRFNRWARELSQTAYNAFTYQTSSGGPRRMYWKMSIDLSYPLVPSMGQHDPLDAYITYVQLQSSATIPAGPNLDAEIGQLKAMVEDGEWATADPLGIGGLLIDAYRVDQLRKTGTAIEKGLLENLLDSALAGLKYYAGRGELQLPAQYRLAFRELGLAIGLQAVVLMWQAIEQHGQLSDTSAGLRTRLQALMQYAPLRDEIESFWRDADHRRANTWAEHQDINEVMLATSLAPDGFLTLY
jgi:hypothetical protein